MTAKLVCDSAWAASASVSAVGGGFVAAAQRPRAAQEPAYGKGGPRRLLVLRRRSRGARRRRRRLAGRRDLRHLDGRRVHYVEAVEVRIEREIRAVRDLLNEILPGLDASRAGGRRDERPPRRRGIHGAVVERRAILEVAQLRGTGLSAGDGVLEQRPRGEQVERAGPLPLGEVDIFEALLEEKVAEQRDRREEEQSDEDELGRKSQVLEPSIGAGLGRTTLWRSA